MNGLKINHFVVCIIFCDEKIAAAQKDESLTLSNCLVAFMDSTRSLYVQEADFEERIAQLQPQIDECFDPFDMSVSRLCVAQYPLDELFYRCWLIKWPEDESAPNAEALVHLIDYGNTSPVSIETVTAMSEALVSVPPLAIHCRLAFQLSDSAEHDDTNSFAYKQLEELVNRETLFDVTLSKREL